MARVTVEDCVTRIKNRFELVIKAAWLTREMNSGVYEFQPDSAHEKAQVSALREIARDKVSGDELGERLVKAMAEAENLNKDDEKIRDKMAKKFAKEMEGSEVLASNIQENKAVRRVTSSDIVEQALADVKEDDAESFEDKAEAKDDSYLWNEDGEIDELDFSEDDDLSPLKANKIKDSFSPDDANIDGSYSGKFDDVADKTDT